MGVKEIIKKRIYSVADSAYQKDIDGAMPAFDEWVRKKESGLERFDMTVDLMGRDIDLSEISRLTYAAKYEGVSVRIIPYEKITKNFQVKNYIEDILVFVNGEITDKAIPLLVKRFQENTEADILYGDEDIAELDVTGTIKYGRSVYGTRRDPYYKHEWSPNAFLNHFYFCNMVAVRRSAFRDLEWAKDLCAAESLYRVLLEYIFKNEFTLRKSVDYIDEILVHARNYDLNRLTDNMADSIAAKYQVSGKNDTKISVVIPSKDNPDLLKSCLGSLKNTFHDGVEYEVIVVDNGSTAENRVLIEEILKNHKARYLYEPMEFNFSAQCNKGVRESAYPLVLLLNDDITFKEPGTLMRMANQAKYSFTGAVGVKLLYPDSTIIQHAGVINNRIGPVHKLQFCDDSVEHYHGYNRMVENVSAVTAACLMVRKDAYEKVGGMDESLKVAFNDVDFCFRLLENGFVNVVCNNICVTHAESVTRGKDTDTESLKRLMAEKDKLYSSHKALKGYDPYFSGKLVCDCLDVRIVPANEFEYERGLENCKKTKQGTIDDAREEKCLQFSLEYAGDMSGFSFKEEDGDKFYFQGFLYIQGSDNACYKKEIILQSESFTEAIPFTGCIRNDVALACKGEVNVERSGFCLSVLKNSLPKGTYRVGVKFTNKYARERLYSFSNKYLVVE